MTKLRQSAVVLAVALGIASSVCAQVTQRAIARTENTFRAKLQPNAAWLRGPGLSAAHAGVQKVGGAETEDALDPMGANDGGFHVSDQSPWIAGNPLDPVTPAPPPLTTKQTSQVGIVRKTAMGKLGEDAVPIDIGRALYYRRGQEANKVPPVAGIATIISSQAQVAFDPTAGGPQGPPRNRSAMASADQTITRQDQVRINNLHTALAEIKTQGDGQPKKAFAIAMNVDPLFPDPSETQFDLSYVLDDLLLETPGPDSLAGLFLSVGWGIGTAEDNGEVVVQQETTLFELEILLEHGDATKADIDFSLLSDPSFTAFSGQGLYDALTFNPSTHSLSVSDFSMIEDVDGVPELLTSGSTFFIIRSGGFGGTVPEPSTFALLAMGAIFVLRRRHI